MARDNRPGRRTELLSTAADLIGTSTLSEVLSFLGPRLLAKEAGISPGTVTHHFPAGEGMIGRLAAGHAFARVPADAAMKTLMGHLDNSLNQLKQLGGEALSLLEAALIEELAFYSPDATTGDMAIEAEETALLLAAAVAPRDEAAASLLREHMDPHRVVTEKLCEEVALILGRTWIKDIDARSMALAINALAFGFICLRRFDQVGAPLQEYARIVLRLFDASTHTLGSEPRDYRESFGPFDSGSGVDLRKRTAIEQAAVSLYEEHRGKDGWRAVSVAAVASKAKVSRPTVVANFRDTNGLAAAVWVNKHRLDLIKYAERSRTSGGPIETSMRDVLISFVSAAKVDPELTHAFVAGILAYAVNQKGEHRPGDPTNPWELIDLPALLQPLIHAHADAFRRGYADTPEDIKDTATLLTHEVLNLSLTRPKLSVPAVVDIVLDTTLRGMIKNEGAAAREW